MYNAASGIVRDAHVANPRPYEVIRTGAAPVLLLCDHASNRVPATLEGLGLGEEDLSRHIAWDIGAAQVTRALARLLGAAAVLSGVSRLVIDCNRRLDDPTSIPSVSDGVPVPGNQGLDAAARSARAAAWFAPYHEAIASEIHDLESAGDTVAVISVHSFTARMDGFARPWPVAVLWDRDERLPVPAMAALRQLGFLVGDNEPYSGRGGYTINRHAATAGRPHVTFEIRQDGLAGEAAAQRWAVILAGVLRPLLALPDMPALKA